MAGEFCTETAENDCSPIHVLYNTKCVEFLEAEILRNESCSHHREFIGMATDLLNQLIKFAEHGVPLTPEDEDNLIYGAWLKPCFYRSLSATIDQKHVEIIDLVMRYSNRKPIDRRTARMESDPHFKLFVMPSGEPSSTTSLRSFLSILIGHWCNEDIIRALDRRMRKNVFGPKLDIILNKKYIGSKERVVDEKAEDDDDDDDEFDEFDEKAEDDDDDEEEEDEKAEDEDEDEVDEFTHVIDDFSQECLEPLRKLMVEKYDSRDDVDVEALIEEVKPKLSKMLTHYQNSPYFVGKRFSVSIMVVNGQDPTPSMAPVRMKNC